jgi:hypothetical protein
MIQQNDYRPRLAASRPLFGLLSDAALAHAGFPRVGWLV